MNESLKSLHSEDGHTKWIIALVSTNCNKPFDGYLYLFSHLHITTDHNILHVKQFVDASMVAQTFQAEANPSPSLGDHCLPILECPTNRKVHYQATQTIPINHQKLNCLIQTKPHQTKPYVLIFGETRCDLINTAESLSYLVDKRT